MVELHPLLSELELRKYCEENNIQIMAYSSTARLDFRLKASRRMEQVCIETGKSLCSNYVEMAYTKWNYSYF